LESLLFPVPPEVAPEARPMPDWDDADRELRKNKRVTRQLLWEEYRSKNPEGYSYTRYCELFHEWRGLQDISMRQVHYAGEKAFVDYAGDTVRIVDPATGEVRDAHVFVGVLGASHYAYAESTWTQSLPDWIASHTRMLAFFGGCPQILVPDNLKAGVKSPQLYEPELNPTYLEFARHYDIAVIPARSRRPKDKAVAESGVQVVERWILARLRNRTFFSLAEANDAIWRLLEGYNRRPFQKRPGSRRSLFEELDRLALRPLPRARYVYAQWLKVRPHIDYHVQVSDHYYSVPHQLRKKQLDARVTGSTIEVFHRNKRVASHARSYVKGGHTTVAEHMPKSHREHAGMTEEELLAWAGRIGPSVVAFVEGAIAARMHPQQAFRSCVGTLRLAKTYGDHRLEKACARAVKLQSFSFKSVKAILKNRLDERPLQPPAPASLPKRTHENVRGGDYYAVRSEIREEENEGSRTC